MNTRLTIISILTACAALWAMSGAAHGQIYVTNSGSGTIGKYDAATGATINAALVSGLFEPFGIAFAGGHIWVALGGGGGPVAEYDATTGAPINAISTPCGAIGVAVSENNLYVVGQGCGGWIGVYDATTGAPINAPLVTGPPLSGVPIYNVAVSGGNIYVVSDGFDTPGSVAVFDAATGALINPSLINVENAVGIVVSGGNLWVGNNGDNNVASTTGLYTTGGATINASLIPGLGSFGMALLGGNLLITNGNTIGEYNATTGAVVNASLVSGLNNPAGIAVVPPNTPVGSNVDVNIGSVGSTNTNIALTFPTVTSSGMTTATPIDPSTAGTLPAGFSALGTDASNLSQAFEITTTATTDTSTAPITIAFQVPLPPGPDVSTLSVFHNEGGALVDRTTSRDETTNTISASVFSLSPFIIAKHCQVPTSIATNFNGTAINSGSYLWFNSVLKPSGLGSNPVTIHFTQQKITSATFTFSVPDAMVTFDPKATSATTTFSNGVWVTRVPSSGLAGNTFLSGLSYQLPSNLPGGIKNVTWSGTMNPDTPGVSVQWKWAGAVYKNFSSNYTALGVKPVDDNNASQYKNSDHAGTPENFKSYLTGGATGGGGSNYTGGYSGTAAVGPCP